MIALSRRCRRDGCVEKPAPGSGDCLKHWVHRNVDAPFACAVMAFMFGYGVGIRSWPISIMAAFGGGIIWLHRRQSYNRLQQMTERINDERENLEKSGEVGE